MAVLKCVFIIYYRAISFKLLSFISADSYLPPQPGVSPTGSEGNIHTTNTNFYSLNLHELAPNESYMGFSQLHQRIRILIFFSRKASSKLETVSKLLFYSIPFWCLEQFKSLIRAATFNFQSFSKIAKYTEPITETQKQNQCLSDPTPEQ